jgi:hypothetical protein
MTLTRSAPFAAEMPAKVHFLRADKCTRGWRTRPSHPSEPPMRDDVVAFCDDELVFVAQGKRVGTTLNVCIDTFDSQVDRSCYCFEARDRPDRLGIALFGLG